MRTKQCPILSLIWRQVYNQVDSMQRTSGTLLLYQIETRYRPLLRLFRWPLKRLA